MPFEPLNTDEKIEGKPPREKSMDDFMLAGCTGFVGCAFSTFFVGMWPFLVFGTSEDYRRLLIAFPLGLIPATILGAYFSKRFGLAAACGFIGGAMALGVFLHLIATRTLVAVFLQAGKEANFPLWLVYLIPVVWVAIALAVAYVFTPKNELRDAAALKKP